MKMDLRVILPPLINILQLLSSSTPSLIPPAIAALPPTAESQTSHGLILIFLFFIAALLLATLLFTRPEISVPPPPNNNASFRLRLLPGHFSRLVALSLLAAVLLPPSLFLPLYLLILLTHPFHPYISLVLRRLSLALRVMPPVDIVFIQSQSARPEIDHELDLV